MPDTPEPSPATQRRQGAYNTVRTVGAFKKKNISISLAGTETPIFLLDESAVVVKVTPTTTAGAAAIAIREQVGLQQVPHPSSRSSGSCIMHTSELLHATVTDAFRLPQGLWVACAVAC